MDLIELKIAGIVPPLRMNIYKNTDMIISPVLKEWGIWEPSETLLSLRYIKSGFNALDIGANIGYYTLLFSRWVGPSGHVYAFEPEPANFHLLQANTLLNQASNVVLSQLALSDERGQGYLYRANQNFGDHRLSYKQGRTKTLVELTTADHFFANRDALIHFIKLDTQGAEEKILRGMQKLIGINAQHLTILMEFSPRLLTLMGSNYISFLYLLIELGARVMLFSVSQDGKIEFNRANVETLENMAIQLLSLEYEDAGTNILLFFSTEAENEFLLSQQTFDEVIAIKKGES